jgi:hypothetical protein
MTVENYPAWLTQFKTLRLPAFTQFPDLDLYMDQVIQETNKYLAPILETPITKTMVNSYVKMELVARPIKKKYNAQHLASIMMISILKTTFTLETIKQLLALADVEATFNQFVLNFNQEIAHLEEPATSFSQLELAIRAVLYKIVLEHQL